MKKLPDGKAAPEKLFRTVSRQPRRKDDTLFHKAKDV